MSDNDFFNTICNTGDGVFIVDASKHIIKWNKGAEKILKYPEIDVLNQECFRIISGKAAPDKPLCGHNCKVHSGVLKGVPQKNFDILSQTNEGEPLWLNVTIISPSNSEEPFIAHIIRDITHEKKTGMALNSFMTDLGSSDWIYKDKSAERTPAKNPSMAHHTTTDQPSTALSGREIEVLTLLAEGLSTKGLAQKLSISHFTARNHIQNILVKLDLHSKAQAVSYAFKKGIF